MHPEDIYGYVWKWHGSFEKAEMSGSIYVEPRPGHAYCLAKQPAYVTEDQWKAFCLHVISLHNALLHKE